MRTAEFAGIADTSRHVLAVAALNEVDRNDGSLTLFTTYLEVQKHVGVAKRVLPQWTGLQALDEAAVWNRIHPIHCWRTRQSCNEIRQEKRIMSPEGRRGSYT